MFCSECGGKAGGKFCSQCGHAVEIAQGRPPIEEIRLTTDTAVDWEQAVRYEQIIRVDEVRAAISRNASSAPKGLSGEALLALYDQFATSPVPLESLAAIVQPLYDSWGIHTGKECKAIIEVPIGRAIARSLCSLAKHGQTLQNADQYESGCVLSAELPSSVCSFKGALLITLTKRGACTQLEAMTNIPGQMYDWGKSQRCLDALLHDLKTDMGLPSARISRKAA